MAHPEFLGYVRDAVRSSVLAQGADSCSSRVETNLAVSQTFVATHIWRRTSAAMDTFPGSRQAATLVWFTLFLPLALAVDTPVPEPRPGQRPNNITGLNYGSYSQTGSYYNGSITFRFSPEKELESERGGAICERYRNETIEQTLDSVVVGITEPTTLRASLNSLFDVQANAWSREPGDATPPKFSLASNGENVWKFSTEDNSTASSYAFNGTLPRENRLRQELNFNFTSCNGSITGEPFHGWLLQYKDRDDPDYEDVDDIEPVLHGSFDSESANFKIRGQFYLTSFDFSVEPYITGVTWIGPITITFNGSIDRARSDDLLLGESSPKWNATLGYTKLLNGSEVTDPNLAGRHGPQWHSFTVLVLASALGLAFTI